MKNIISCLVNAWHDDAVHQTLDSIMEILFVIVFVLVAIGLIMWPIWTLQYHGFHTGTSIVLSIPIWMLEVLAIAYGRSLRKHCGG